MHNGLWLFFFSQNSVIVPPTKFICWSPNIQHHRMWLCLEKRLKKKSRVRWSHIQIRSVAQSCPTLCDPMNRSTPGLPVHHQLPEFTETHVHQVSDAIQPSHPLSSPSPPSPPAPNPSQHQSLGPNPIRCSYEEKTRLGHRYARRLDHTKIQEGRPSSTKQGEMSGTDSSLMVLKRSQTYWHFDLGLLELWENILFHLSHQVCGIYYSNSRKLIHGMA